MRNRIILSVTLSIILLVSGCSEKKSGNLLSNASFEGAANKKGVPASWNPDIWSEKEDEIQFQVETGDAADGKQFVTITAGSSSDVKLAQEIAIKSNSIYKLSGYIKTSGIPKSGSGANLSFLNLSASSDNVYDTAGKWQYIEFYGRTGPKQKSLVPAFRIGNYGSPNTGKASFDNIKLEKVSSVPATKAIINLYDDNPQPAANDDRTSPSGRKGIPFFYIILFSILYIFVFIAIYMTLIRKDLTPKVPIKNILTLYVVLIVIAFLSRMIMAPIIEGFQNDIGCFRGWSNDASTLPFSQFYAPPRWCDYPPGYIYVLAAIGHLVHFFHIDMNSPASLLFLKFPAILSDILIAVIIYRIARKKLKETTAIGLSLLYAFNPGVFLNSAIWGQVDSVSALFILLIIACIMDDQIWLGAIIMGFTILVKLQTGFMAIILLYTLIQKKDIKTWILSVMGGLAAFLLTIIPFNPNQNPYWILDLIAAALFIGVFLVNFFMHKTELQVRLLTLFIGISAIIMAALIVITGWSIFSIFQIIFIVFGLLSILLANIGGGAKKERSKWLLSMVAGASAVLFTVLPFIAGRSIFWIIKSITTTVSYYKYATINSFNFLALFKGNWARLEQHMFLNVNFATWSYIAAALIILFITFLYFKSKEISKTYVVSLVFIALVCMFMVVMHERYNYPVLMLSLMCLAFTGSKHFLAIFMGFTITFFVNVGYILDLLIREKFVGGNDIIMITVSLLNLAIIIYLVLIAVKVLINKNFLNFNKPKGITKDAAKT